MMIDEKELLARKRFTALNITRFIGVASAMAGAANIGGRLLPELTPWLGYLLLVNGAADVFLLPALLKKGWAKADGKTG